MNIEVKNSEKPLDYVDTIKVLEKRVEDVYLGKKDELVWILEHNTVFTAGTRAAEHDILDKNLKIIQTNRGGKVTLHSPGQKIIYFVLNLNKRKKDVRLLINKIENCIIRILQEYKIKSFSDKENIGIWIKKEQKKMKIAAIGIRIKKWIAYHGFSINVSNDLSQYKKIIPCGIKDKGITSLKQIGIKNYNDINDIIIKKFLETFHSSNY